MIVDFALYVVLKGVGSSPAIASSVSCRTIQKLLLRQGNSAEWIFLSVSGLNSSNWAAYQNRPIYDNWQTTLTFNLTSRDGTIFIYFLHQELLQKFKEINILITSLPDCPPSFTLSLISNRANYTSFCPVFLRLHNWKTKQIKSNIKRAKHVFSKMKNRTDGSLQHQELWLCLWHCVCPWKCRSENNQTCSLETLGWSNQQILFGSRDNKMGQSLSIKPNKDHVKDTHKEQELDISNGLYTAIILYLISQLIFLFT